MWEKLKGLPLFVKVIIGFFVGINAIGLVFMAIAPSPNPNPNPNPQPPENPGQQVAYPNGNDPQGEVNPPNTNNGRGREEASGDDKSQLIARYKAQMAQIWSQTQQCYQESLREIPMLTQPQCVQNYSQWSIQAGMLQTYITRLETGNPNITFCQANNYPRGCEGVQIASGSGSSSSSGGSGGSSDDGNYDMQAIRGHTKYTDADGDVQELPTAPYYFKDKQTGEFVSSQYPTPPNNTHTYEQMYPEN
jgi:hypothetical protein